MRMAPLSYAVDRAVEEARLSPCAKSKRGVVIYRPHAIGRAISQGAGVVSSGFNAQPSGRCEAADAGREIATGASSARFAQLQIVAQLCRDRCGERCVHAEEEAIMMAALQLQGQPPPWSTLEAVHVKIDSSGALVAGGHPSCVKCSRWVARMGLGRFWLFEADDETGQGTWRGYTASEFHETTLRNLKLM